MNLLGKLYLILFGFIYLFQIENSDILLISPKVKYVSESDLMNNGNIETVFLLSNRGTLPILILSVNPHCSCTDFFISSMVIMPNETETLSLVVPFDQLQNLGEVYAVIKTDSKQKFFKVSIRIQK